MFEFVGDASLTKGTTPVTVTEGGVQRSRSGRPLQCY